MSFAENLKLIRKERNLSQEELAEMIDVRRQAVSNGNRETDTLKWRSYCCCRAN